VHAYAPVSSDAAIIRCCKSERIQLTYILPLALVYSWPGLIAMRNHVEVFLRTELMYLAILNLHRECQSVIMHFR
jgi:hypothetical protein